MKYFFKITQSYSAKNKLYEAMQKHAASLDGTLIDSYLDLVDFRNAVIAKAAELHQEHSRCQPLSVNSTHDKSWHGPEETEGSSLMVQGCFDAKFYPVKNIYPNF